MTAGNPDLIFWWLLGQHRTSLSPESWGRCTHRCDKLRLSTQRFLNPDLLKRPQLEARKVWAPENSSSHLLWVTGGPRGTQHTFPDSPNGCENTLCGPSCGKSDSHSWHTAGGQVIQRRRSVPSNPARVTLFIIISKLRSELAVKNLSCACRQTHLTGVLASVVALVGKGWWEIKVAQSDLVLPLLESNNYHKHTGRHVQFTVHKCQWSSYAVNHTL